MPHSTAARLRRRLALAVALVLSVSGTVALATAADPSDVAAASLPAPSRTVAACTSGVRCRAPRVAVRTGIPLTPLVRCSRTGSRCRLAYDLYTPTNRGPWPVVVLSPGGPTPPTGSGHLVDFATRIAGTGAVVLVASWRQGADYAAPPPVGFRDIGCAIRTAHAIAGTVGGDPGRVALVGHSLGAWADAAVVLDAVRSRPTSTECLVGTGSSRPVAFVGLAGAYAGPEGGADDVDWVHFIGATARARPDLWYIADPIALARVSTAARIPMVLVHGSADSGVDIAQTTAFARALRAAGRSVSVVVISGAGHMTLLTHTTTLAAIAGTLARLP